MSRIVGVTGATGFIGAAFVRLAHECGYEVRPFSRTGNGAFRLDLSSPRIDPRLLEGCDIVVHLAGRLPAHGTDEAEARECLEINALGTLRLMKAMRDAGVWRLIQATAANAYASWCTFPDELSPLYPQTRTAYLSSKVLQELYAQSYGAAHRLSVTSLRISSPYGPQPDRNTIGRMAESLLSGRSVRLQNSGCYGADFVLVSDVARAIMLLESEQASGVWNVASGKRWTIHQIARILGRFTAANESQIECEMEDGAAASGFPAIDIAKIRGLGFVPTDIETGLHATVEALRSTRPIRSAAAS